MTSQRAVRAFASLLATLSVLGIFACDDQTGPIDPEMQVENEHQTLRPVGPSRVWSTMGDESDYWETMTPTQGVYVEFYAADQTPQPTDGDGKTRVCPNDQLIYKNAQLRMQHPITGENIDLEFRGPFTFIRHVSTTSPYPTALYEFNKHAYSYDKKYFAPAGNNVLLACDGNYIIRNSYMRFWSGYFYGKLYNGPIEENPNYKCDEENTYFYTTYDPYSSSGGEQKCSSGSSDGTSPNGSSWNCHWEWVIIEVNDGGGWTTYWEGWATICG